MASAKRTRQLMELLKIKKPAALKPRFDPFYPRLPVEFGPLAAKMIKSSQPNLVLLDAQCFLI